MNYNQVNEFRQESGNAGQMGGMLSDGMEGLTGKNIQTELAAKLQTTVVGGYTKKSVEEYALEMRNNLMLIKMQLEQQIRELTAEKVSVYQECQVIREQLNTAEEKLSDAIAQKERAKQEVRLSAEKIEEWESQYSGYEEMREQKEQYEDEISRKEHDISRLNEQLSNYQRAYESLQTKMMEMEKAVEKASVGFSQQEMEELQQKKQEMEELRQQKEESEQKYKRLLSKLEENTIDLEKERVARKEVGDQQVLMAEKGKLEKQLDVLQKQYEEQEDHKKELEEKVDVLYKNYAENSSRLKKQDQLIEEKELLLKHYQEQEQGAILTSRENQKLKDTIDSLKETIRLIIEQMETQSESMNLFIERTTQERDTIKKVIGEQASLKLQNVELLDIQRELLVQIDNLKSQNLHLEKGLEQQKKVLLPIEREKSSAQPDKQPSQGSERESADPELYACDKAMQKARGLFSVMEGENAEKTKEVKNIG
jgi:chromosome segregation ATPase